MQVLPIRVHNRVVTKFKQEAKRAWPKESFAYILGNEGPGYLEISDIWIPEDIDKFTTKMTICLQDHWAVQVIDYCEDHDLTPLGSLHSHPYSYAEMTVKGKKVCTPDHSTSEGDALCGITSKIHGICRVLESKRGRLTATIRFWGPELPLGITYIDGK